MKHIIILGDGMADYPVERLAGKTPMQYAYTPYMDKLASEGRTGRLVTVPAGYQPGSEVANTAILGYNLDDVYEGRGPLEAASIGYDMTDDDFAIRCNIITISDGKIVNHHGGHLSTAEGGVLIDYLNTHLGSDKVRFITGIQYRHLLVIKGASKYIECFPPHDHPNEPWKSLLVKPLSLTPEQADKERRMGRMSPQETADLINDLIVKSHELLDKHPFNANRHLKANSIWPWSGGYRPDMLTLQQTWKQVKRGAVISAVDLIRGIGKYAGLRTIIVDGMTGLADTNYENKAQAAIEALKTDDFVFLHVEASDEAGHDGDLPLKLKTIENLDRRIVKPIYEAVVGMDEGVRIAVLPDHLTPVELRIHVGEPVPFLIWQKGMTPDDVRTFDEISCVSGSYGLIRLQQFMQVFMSDE